MGYNLARYGRWCLVTGASAGFGVHFAHAAARDGLNLALAARRRDRLEKLAEELEADYGVQTLVIELDLARPESTARVAEALGEREIALLVLNAGFCWHGLLRDMSEDMIAQMVNTNCTSYATLARRFLPGMVERGRGALILVSSVLGFFPGPWSACYAATKAFDLMLGESLRGELRGTGVDVLNLCPGRTATEFHEVANPHKFRRKVAPELKMDDPQQVVDLALKNLGRKTTVYPGQGVAAAIVTRLFPRSWTMALAARVMERETH
ncbi:MAG TPA: SDR family NAD(P)-dependent oxidoreductase [Candidatus Glassbacteria bacterium]|nr:SDR family NAD(P)-dependent oxidoreductase [Candidatus Glassbacteria bacterium]